MSTYRVELSPSAQKELVGLERANQKRILKRLEQLAELPRGPGIEKLTGNEALYRIRAGDYRVVFEIHDNRLVVLVVRIRHRREVYR